MPVAPQPSPPQRSLPFLVALSMPALSLAMIFGVNNPALFHLILSRFVDAGQLDASRLNSAIGALGLLGLLVSALSQPVFGLLSDRTRTRLGRRYPFMLVGTLALLAGLLGEIYAVNFWGLAAAILLTSAALSAIQSPLHALIPDQVPSTQMGYAAGLKTVLELVGIIGGGALVWLFLGTNNQPLAAVLVMNGLLLGGVLWTLRQAPESPKLSAPRRMTTRDRFQRLYGDNMPRWALYARLACLTLRHVGRRRSFVWWLLHRVCLFGAFGILSKFTITYLVDVFGFSQAAARELQGQLIVFLGLLLMATPLVTGILSDRVGRRRLVVIAGLLAASSTLVVSQTRSLELAIGMMALVGMGTSVFFSVGWAIVTSIVPARQAAFYMGLTNIATSLGTACGLAGGFVVDGVNAYSASTTLGYRVLLVMAGLFFVVSAAAIAQTSEQAEPVAVSQPGIPVPQS